jgi:hypothetical protein
MMQELTFTFPKLPSCQSHDYPPREAKGHLLYAEGDQRTTALACFATR